MAPELKNDLVTILMRADHSVARVEASIKSAQAQTYWHWEMLVLLDSSAPRELIEYVRTVSEQEPRVRGLFAANPDGTHDIRGRFVAFFESGALWEPTKLDKQLKLLRDTFTGLSYTGFRPLSRDGSKVGRPIIPPAQLTYTDLLKANRIARFTAVVDQKVAGPVALDANGEDGLWLKIVKDTGAAEGLVEDLASGPRTSGATLRSWKLYRQREGLSRSASLYFYLSHAVLGLAEHLQARVL